MKSKHLICIFLLLCLILCACSPDTPTSTTGAPDEEDDDIIITLKTDAFTLQTEETAQIEYSASAQNAPVTFSSSDVNVATVDSDGLILAVGKGNAVITVSAGEYSKAYVNVTVAAENLKALPSIVLANTELELICGTEFNLNATVKLGVQVLDDAVLTWDSSDESVLSIEEGIITAKKAGTATVTVSTQVNGLAATATCEVAVYDYYRIELDRESVYTAVGKEFTLNARVYDIDGNEVLPLEGELEAISSDASSVVVAGSGFRVIHLGAPSVGFRFRGNVATIPVEIYSVNADFFTGSVKDYYGTVAGETFSGLVFESKAYQPHVYFSEYGVEQIKAYAEENGYTTLRVHAYAIVTNNALVLNMTKWFNEKWDYHDLSMSDITTTYDFWSQSEGSTECYLWFEFL